VRLPTCGDATCVPLASIRPGALCKPKQPGAGQHGCYTAPVPTPTKLTAARRAIATAGGLGLAVGGFHYAALWPASRLFGESLIAGDDPAEVALTYDDGPNGACTSALLELLERHQVRATFFVIGQSVRRQPEMVRALYRAGHAIGCHTMTHPRLMYMPAGRIRGEIADATALIEDTLGARIGYFRPPFGGRNPAVFAVLRELGLTPVLWNVNARDWKSGSAEQIFAHMTKGIARNQRRRQGSNLLLHDGSHLEIAADRSRTIAATATLLASAHERGIRFVTLDGFRSVRVR
jgi:peptidoglycan-N-acetylglucosamine deacetylase